MFPIEGTIRFLQHPKQLWWHAVMPVVLSIILAFFLLILFFVKLFEPQETYIDNWKLWDWHGTWDVTAFVLAFLVVIAEVGFVILLLYTLLDTFVATRITASALEIEGMIDTLKQKYGSQDGMFDMRAHEISGLKDLGCVRSATHGISFMLLRLPLWLLSLVLSSWFPPIALIVFPLLDGWAFTWSYLTDFLPIVGMKNCKDQAKFVWKHLDYFAAFGAASILLILIPFAGILFLFGAAYGAALLFQHLIEEEGLLSGDQLTAPILANRNAGKGLVTVDDFCKP